MRLTLRTLLAYLDDVLEPARAKEIGGKIAESSMATALVNRIRDVLRRRRLKAPALEGGEQDLDPNLVAEYLDNTLPPENVADVERVSLNSDVHLAEIASCHQILTLVLGEPVDIPAQTRERMYALGPVSAEAAELPTGEVQEPPSSGHVRPSVTEPPAGAEAGPREAAPAAAPAAGAARPVQPAAGSTTSPRPLSETMPDYLKRRPLWRRTLPAAAVILLVAVWLGAIIYDPTLSFVSLGESEGARETEPDESASGGPQVASATGASDEPADPASPSAQPTESKPAPQQEGSETDTGSSPPRASETGEEEKTPQDGPQQERATDEATVPSLPQPVEGIDPEPPPDMPETDGESADTETTMPVPDEIPPLEGLPDDLTPDDAGAPTPQTAPSPAPSNPEADPENSPDAADSGETGQEKDEGSARGVTQISDPELNYVSQEGVLLHFDAEQSAWAVLPHDSVIPRDKALACPKPFEAEIRTGEGRARVTLLGGTAARVLPVTQAAPFGFELRQGRLIIESPKKDDEESSEGEGLVVAVGLGSELWRVELLTPGTRCGIEIVPRMPVAPKQDLGADSYRGQLVVGAGTVRFADGSGAVTVLDAADNPRLPLAPSERRAAIEEPTSGASSSVPGWLDRQEPPVSSLRQRYAKQFAREFDRELPVSLTLPAVMEGRRPQFAEWATQALALVGDYAALAKALARADHREARLAAIAGLRRWLGEDPENGKRLKDELEKHFLGRHVDAVARLLWGYSEEDLRRRDVAEQLVTWLEHEHIAVRQLAIYHIVRLTRQRRDYYPHRPPGQRKAAVARWRDQIERYGGLLPPRE